MTSFRFAFLNVWQTCFLNICFHNRLLCEVFDIDIHLSHTTIILVFFSKPFQTKIFHSRFSIPKSAILSRAWLARVYLCWYAIGCIQFSLSKCTTKTSLRCLNCSYSLSFLTCLPPNVIIFSQPWIFRLPTIVGNNNNYNYYIGNNNYIIILTNWALFDILTSMCDIATLIKNTISKKSVV